MTTRTHRRLIFTCPAGGIANTSDAYSMQVPFTGRILKLFVIPITSDPTFKDAE